MTKAKSYMTDKVGMCDMCGVVKDLGYYVANVARVCSSCYESIPEHIPLSQDSIYIKSFKRKMNDTEERYTKRNS